MTDSTDTQRVLALVERSLLACVTGVLGGIVGGLIFAVIGWFHWLGVGLPALVIGVAAWKTVGGRLPAPPERKSDRVAVIVTAIAIIVLTALSAVNPGEHLWTGRDPATYLATAGWLAESGNLLVEARSGPFSETAELDFAVNGFYDERSDGRLAPQFFHAFPVLMAAVGQLLGLGGMLTVNAVIGGLGLWAVFALTSRLTGPVGGLVAVLLLGLNPVFVYFTRAPFTEPLSLVFLTTGLWLLIAENNGDSFPGWVGGALLGGAVMARVDALLVLIPLLAVARVGHPYGRIWARPIVRGFLLVAGIGLAEVAWISPWYIGHLNVELLAVGLGAALVIGVSLVPEPMIARLRAWIGERRPTVATAAALAVVAAVAFGLFVRPHLGTTTGTPYDIVPIQEANQLPIEPDRIYAEYSLHWLLWYVGPVALVVGISGLVLMARRAIRGLHNRGVALWLLTVALFSGAYLWRPFINPDQIWAMRRFLPVVFPALAVGAAVALRALWARTSQGWQATAAVVAVVAVAGVGYGYADIWDLHEFDGLSSDFKAACGSVGPDAAVLLVDSPEAPLSGQLTQGFRSFCHLPAVATDIGSMSPQELSVLGSDWSLQNRRLVVVGSEQALDSLGVAYSETLFASDYPLLEYTLMRRPQEQVIVRGSTSFGRVPG